MSKEHKKIIKDAMLSGPRSPTNPLLAPEHVQRDSGFEFPPLPSDCVDDEVTTSSPQAAWDLDQYDDGFELLLQQPTACVDEEPTITNPILSAQTQPAWDLLQAGPSNTPADLFSTEPEPCPTQSGPCPTQSGPCPTQSGPCPTQSGPCPTQSGPCPTQSGPCPTQSGPCPTQSGPCPTRPGPCPTHLGSFPSQQGHHPNQTSNCPTQAGPSSIKLQTMTVKCEYCNKVYANKFNLKRHVNTIHSEDPTVFKCDFCEKLFLRNDRLEEHLKYKHSKESECQCLDCGRTFTTASSRIRHIQSRCPSLREQLLQDTGDTGKMLHTCPNCGNTYTLRTNLRRHLRLECGVPPQFSCPQCSYKAHHKSALKTHMSRKHGAEYTQ